MFIADAHCDTILKLYKDNQALKNSDCQLKLSSCPQLQFFACFVENYENSAVAFELINKFYNDCYDILNESEIKSVLCIENGKALDGRIENLFKFYELGVRLLTLTWNGENELGGGVGCDFGLSDFGSEVVLEMDRLNMLIDVSHASDKTFWDVCNSTNNPIVATHSNSRKICEHMRNLTDEQIKELINRQGFIGLNFYPDFLEENADINSIVRHAEHILNLGGENILGFGSDFDGIDKLPIGILGSESYEFIAETFKSNFGEEIAKKIAGENLLRFASVNLRR